MSLPQEPFVARLAWDDVAARIAEGAAGILPIGAAAKQHGRHLPMDTDQIQAEWLAETIAAQLNTLIWPTVTYGYYPAFLAYAGSVSLTAATFKAMLREIITGLLAHRLPVILILNTGISTIAPIDDLLRDIRDARLHHLKTYDGPRYLAAVQQLSAQPYGSHADEVETSRMLALEPDKVAMSRAEASPMPGPFRGPLTPHDKGAPGYSPSGSFGDPTLATREKGVALQRAMTEDVMEMARHALGKAS